MTQSPSHTKQSSLLRTRSHHRDPNCRLDVIKELQQDALKPEGGGRTVFTLAQTMRISEHHVMVNSVSDLQDVPSKLGNDEYAVALTFSTPLVDATAQLGLFPMALDMVGWTGTHMVLAPKCHRERSFTYISKRVPIATSAAVDSKTNGDDDEVVTSPSRSIGNDRQVLFDYSKLGLSRKFLKKLVVRVHFVVKPGELSMTDVHQAFAMIRRQHSENWLCAHLRSCVHHMLMAPHAHKTNFYVLVVAEKDAPPGEPIIACDIGYLVGDIVTAYTGAYEVDGSGSVTLGASAKILELLGIPIWDLGMSMPYKKAVLGTTIKKRKDWLQTVKQHRELYAKEVAKARAEIGIVGVHNGDQSSPGSQTWLCASADDPTNAGSNSLLMQDPRKQRLLQLLASGVCAEVLMSSSTGDDLTRCHSADTKPTVDVADDNAIGPATVPSKNQQKKSAKAAAVAAKKANRKEKSTGLTDTSAV